jgi:hypothetical protein
LPGNLADGYVIIYVMLQIRDGASPEDFKAANATQQVTETSKNA